MGDLVKQLLHATVSVDGDFDVGCNIRDAAVERLEREEAATAAAYEVAARAIMEKCHDDMDRKEEAAIVRALATPDQNAALDRLIAEAEARVWKRAMQAVDALPEAQSPDVNVGVANAYAAIRTAASKKGAP